jgi:tetratricopeptide (TPR) repeat protein
LIQFLEFLEKSKSNLCPNKCLADCIEILKKIQNEKAYEILGDAYEKLYSISSESGCESYLKNAIECFKKAKSNEKLIEASSRLAFFHCFISEVENSVESLNQFAFAIKKIFTVMKRPALKLNSEKNIEKFFEYFHEFIKNKIENDDDSCIQPYFTSIVILLQVFIPKKSFELGKFYYLQMRKLENSLQNEYFTKILNCLSAQFWLKSQKSIQIDLGYFEEIVDNFLTFCDDPNLRINLLQWKSIICPEEEKENYLTPCLDMFDSPDLRKTSEIILLHAKLFRILLKKKENERCQKNII